MHTALDPLAWRWILFAALVGVFGGVALLAALLQRLQRQTRARQPAGPTAPMPTRARPAGAG